ncbi:MAG: uncharacterized protein QG628_159 [Patescibacteria group bacterium]|jgi:hypothetical protein|nr:uncharacterized protein [Patescibacteria group bacterium]
MIKKFPEFSNLSSISPKLLIDITDEFEPYSDFNFVSLFSWDTEENTQISLLGRNLILKMDDYGDNKRFLTFIGDENITNTIDILLNYLKTDSTLQQCLRLIPKVVVDAIADSSLFKITEDIDNNDYVLSTEESIDLPGGKYQNKRKSINRFVRTYEDSVKIKILELDNKDNHNNIKKLLDKWIQNKGNNEVIIDSDIDAINKILKYFSFLKGYCYLECMAIYIDDILVGFCIYELLDNGWAISHFGKCDNTFLNLYEYMMISVLRELNSRNYTFLNYEQDLGLPGLRASKSSSIPTKFLYKYTISSGTK